MARGLNKVMLIGNLGAEPQTNTFQNGSVTNFTMVTNESRRNSQTGQYEEVGEWHRIVCWNKLGETAARFLHKGSKIYIEGKLRTRSYTDKQGIKRYTTEIYADEMVMLDSRPQGVNDASTDQSYSDPNRQPSMGNAGGFTSQTPYPSYGQRQAPAASVVGSNGEITNTNYNQNYGNNQANGGYASVQGQNMQSPVQNNASQGFTQPQKTTTSPEPLGTTALDDEIPF